MKYFILILCFAVTNGFSQVRITYNIQTNQLTKEQQGNEIVRTIKELSGEFRFFLEIQSSKSHFYLEDTGMSSEGDASRKHYHKLAQIQYVNGEEFWTDSNLNKMVTKINGQFIEYKLSSPAWKITSETKKIDKYDCYKAQYIHTYTSVSGKLINREITAWFAPELPYSFGPGKYFGLPGLILELDDGKGTVYLAGSISINANIKKIELPENTIEEEQSEKEVKDVFELRKKQKIGQ